MAMQSSSCVHCSEENNTHRNHIQIMKRKVQVPMFLVHRMSRSVLPMDCCIGVLHINQSFIRQRVNGETNELLISAPRTCKLCSPFTHPYLRVGQPGGSAGAIPSTFQTFRRTSHALFGCQYGFPRG